MSIIIKGGSSSDLSTVKPASTTPVATDPALVVSLSPNSAATPVSTGAATSALQTALNAQIPATLGAKTTSASLAVNIASDQTVPVSAASLPLPTGAATNAILTGGTQKTQIVDGSNNVIPSLSDGAGGFALEVAQSATLFSFLSGNSSTTQLAAGATFTGTIDLAINTQSYSVLVTSDQNGTLLINQFIDAAGTRLAQQLSLSVAANVGLARSGVINGNYIQFKFTNNGGSPTTTLNVNAYYGTIPSATQLNNGPVALNEVNGTALSLGQATMAASIPVVIASNQSNLPSNIAQVAGTNTVTAGVAGLLAIGGNVATASTDSGNPVKVGGVYTTTTPALTTGQRGDLQLDVDGKLRVTTESTKATFSAATIGLVPAAAATDIFTITGSATKTIKVTSIEITGTQTTGGAVTVVLLRRSTANSAGTSTAPTVVQHDTTSAAGTATVLAYTANPTAGTLVGNLRAVKVNAPAATGAPTATNYPFIGLGSLMVLRGTGQVLAFNLNGATVAGGSLNIWVEWTEE